MTFSEGVRGGSNPTKKEAKASRIIPEHEMQIEFVRSGGAGGQKVNKTSSKAQLRWNVGNSQVFSEEEKALIRQNLAVTKDDEILLNCDEERSQSQNRAACIERLHANVLEAIKVDAPRVATKKSQGRRNRELDQKTKEGQKKKQRGRVDLD